MREDAEVLSARRARRCPGQPNSGSIRTSNARILSPRAAPAFEHAPTSGSAYFGGGQTVALRHATMAGGVAKYSASAAKAASES